MINKSLINIYFLVLLLTSLSCINLKPNTKNALMKPQQYTYLALGDSYTIGEGVEESGRYPNQAATFLKSSGVNISQPKFIAKTGWTTDELVKGILEADIKDNEYDLVTLLIGVNNQYRGRPVDNFETEFRDLLDDAIDFAGGNPNHVIVLSIPDWGITPFATDRETEKEKVATEIDAYNSSKKQISSALGVHYIDITEEYRKTGSSSEMLVSDKLHPSALVYLAWAKKIQKVVEDKMGFK